MEYKRILFTEPGRAELVSAEIAPPGPGEVLVRLAVSTISSGTERANLVGDVNINTLSRDPVAHWPRSSGYSTAGTVEAVGEGVTDVKPGDRVAMASSKHSQYICLPRHNLTLLTDDVSFEEAALFFIATFPLAAVRKCRTEMGEAAIVMGLGVLGQLAVRLLRVAGAVPILAADPVESRREKALAGGADAALDPFSADFVSRVREITGGRAKAGGPASATLSTPMSEIKGGGAKVGIEVTGFGSGLDGILDCMAPFGRVALLGCTRNSDFTIDYYRKVHGPGITLIGAHTMARPSKESHPGWWTDSDDREAILRLVSGGRLQLKDLIEDTRSPEEAPEVYRRLAAEKSFPVTQFDWRRL